MAEQRETIEEKQANKKATALATCQKLIPVLFDDNNSVCSVFTEYLKSKQGLKGINAHKKPAAEAMRDFLAFLQPRAKSPTNDDLRKCTVYCLQALVCFLAHAKEVVSSDRISKKSAKKAVSATQRGSINTEGDLIPKLLNWVVAMLSLSEQDAQTFHSFKNIHEKIDFVTKSLLSLSHSLTPYRKDSIPSHIVQHIQFAMDLVGYLLRQGHRRFTSDNKTKHAKERLLPALSRFDQLTVKDYCNLLQLINEGIRESRSAGRSEESTYYEDILTRHRDLLIRQIVIEDSAGLNGVEGETVSSGFTDQVKLQILDDMFTVDASPETIPLLNSLDSTLPKSIVKGKLRYLELVFNPPTHNHQKPNLPAHLYRHAEQIAATINYLLDYPAFVESLIDKNTVKRLHFYAYVFNRYIADYAQTNDIKPPANYLVSVAKVTLGIVREFSQSIPEAYRDCQWPASIAGAGLQRTQTTARLPVFVTGSSLSRSDSTVEFDVNQPVIRTNIATLNLLMSQEILINSGNRAIQAECRAVYQIAYMAWRIRTSSSHEVIQLLAGSQQLKTILETKQPPLAGIVQEILSAGSYNTADEAGALAFVTALLAHPKIKAQIPEDWKDCGPVTGGYVLANAFPRSARNEWTSNNIFDAQGSFNANHDGAFISTAGPNWPDGGESTFDNFLTLVMRKKPWCIIPVGQAKDYGNYWLEDHDSEKFSVTVKSVSGAPERKLMVITDKTSDSQHQVHVVNIEVADQAPLKLDTEGAMQILSIWENTDMEHPVLAHCASGVGRTGQVKWLFGLLNAIRDNERFAQLIDKSFSDQLTGAEQQEIVTIAERVLSAYRKTRYTVESRPQLLATLPALFMLRAVQLRLEPAVIAQIQQSTGVDDYAPARFVTDLPEEFRSHSALPERDGSSLSSASSSSSSSSNPAAAAAGGGQRRPANNYRTTKDAPPRGPKDSVGRPFDRMPSVPQRRSIISNSIFANPQNKGGGSAPTESATPPGERRKLTRTAPSVWTSELVSQTSSSGESTTPSATPAKPTDDTSAFSQQQQQTAPVRRELNWAEQLWNHHLKQQELEKAASTSSQDGNGTETGSSEPDKVPPPTPPLK